MYGDHYGKPELRELIAAEHPNFASRRCADDGWCVTALFIVSTSLLQAGDRLLVAFPNYATNIETPRQMGCEMDFIR